MAGWRGHRIGRAAAAAAALAVAAALAPLPGPSLRPAAQAAASIGPAVLGFGDATVYGDPTALRPARPIVGMASTPDGGGYWLVASDGGVFSFGSARFHGSTGGIRLNQPIVGMAATLDGGGYWLVASDGGVFSFGTARFHGSTGGIRLNQPIVGMAAAPDGGGYWLVASDGGVFSFGSARFHGSTGGIRLNQPIVGMAAAPAANGGGYWMVASDGGMFSFGTARFHGSTAGTPLHRPIVGMAATPDGSGYWLLSQDGSLFSFGTAPQRGDAAQALGTTRVAAAITATSGQGYRILAVPGTIRVGFTGDVHGVGRVGALLAAGGNPLGPMTPALAANDVNVVNLETAVGSLGTAQVKQYVFHSPPSLLAALRSANVQVANLANNHSLDYGAVGLLETIDHVRAAGLVPVGAGANAAAAYAPAVLSGAGGTVAVLGLSQVVPPGWAATATSPGVASAYDTAAAADAVRRARAAADHVVVMVHWGTENADCPNAKQTALAALLFDAGADVVAGGHPHRLQPIVPSAGATGSRVVAYSLGNFVWYDNTSPNDLTGLFSVELGDTGVRGYGLSPARIDSTGTPVPLAAPIPSRC